MYLILMFHSKKELIKYDFFFIQKLQRGWDLNLKCFILKHKKEKGVNRVINS